MRKSSVFAILLTLKAVIQKLSGLPPYIYSGHSEPESFIFRKNISYLKKFTPFYTSNRRV